MAFMKGPFRSWDFAQHLLEKFEFQQDGYVLQVKQGDQFIDATLLVKREVSNLTRNKYRPENVYDTMDHISAAL